MYNALEYEYKIIDSFWIDRLTECSGGLGEMQARGRLKEDGGVDDTRIQLGRQYKQPLHYMSFFDIVRVKVNVSVLC